MTRDREERRGNGGLTPEQIEIIKEAVLASVYEDIGRSLVRKILWTVGAVFIALSIGMSFKDVIKDWIIK